MPSPESVAVVIRCRNEEAHIGRLLTGIMRQANPPSEIVLVDSGSTDATLAIASAFPVEIVHIEPEDFSFGAACNLGCEHVNSDVAVFVSAHCYPVYDTWLEKLTAPFEDSSVALSYGRQMGPPSARFSEQRIFGQWFPAESSGRQKLPFCNNANAAIRMDQWRAGLRYDEDLTGLEDMAWAKAAIDSGYYLSYVADAVVIHVHEETTRQIVNRYRREAIAHREIYERQSMRMRHAIRLAAINVAGDYSAAARQHVLGKHLIDIPRFRAAQFYGSFRGFTQTGKVTDALKWRFYFPDRSEGPAIRPDSEIGTPIDYEEASSETESTVD